MDSIHDYVLEQLDRSRGHWREVADGSGVSIRTIEKIARKTIKDPRVRKLEMLAKYFREHEKRAV